MKNETSATGPAEGKIRLSHLPVPYQSLDARGRILDVNRRWLSILGYCKNDVVGKSFLAFLAPGNPTHFKKQFPQFKKHGSIHDCELELKKADGSTAHMDLMLSPMKDDTGRVTYVVEASRDITCLMQAAEKIEESEKKYRDLTENINDIIYCIDTRGTVTYISPVVKDRLGWSVKGTVGRNVADFVHPEDLPLMKDGIKRALAGEHIPLDFRLHTKRGGYRWMRSLSREILDDGKPVGLQGVLTDIHDRKMAEEALAELNATLEEKVAERTRELKNATKEIYGLLEFKDSFIRQLSHDLRTPLMPLTTILPMLKDELSDEEDKKYLQVCIDNTGYLTRLVADTLAYSMLDKGCINVDRKPTDVGDIIHSVVSSNRQLYKAHGLDVKTRIAKHLTPVSVDATRIREVLENLTSNAIKFTPRGGHPHLRCEAHGRRHRSQHRRHRHRS